MLTDAAESNMMLAIGERVILLMCVCVCVCVCVGWVINEASFPSGENRLSFLH